MARFRSTDEVVNIRMVVTYSHHPHRLEGSPRRADNRSRGCSVRWTLSVAELERDHHRRRRRRSSPCHHFKPPCHITWKHNLIRSRKGHPRYITSTFLPCSRGTGIASTMSSHRSTTNRSTRFAFNRPSGQRDPETTRPGLDRPSG
jgi:hypothetical protein